MNRMTYWDFFTFKITTLFQFVTQVQHQTPKLIQTHITQSEGK